VIPATATDHRIKAVATVSASDLGSWFRDGLGRTQNPEVLQALLDAAGAARIQEAQGRPVRRLRTHPDSEPECGHENKSVTRHIHDGWEYYRTSRAYHPRTENWFVLRSIDLIAQFDAFRLIDLISPRPLLMVAGSETVTDYFSREAIAKAREPKELFWIDGAT